MKASARQGKENLTGPPENSKKNSDKARIEGASVLAARNAIFGARKETAQNSVGGREKWMDGMDSRQKGVKWAGILRTVNPVEAADLENKMVLVSRQPNRRLQETTTDRDLSGTYSTAVPASTVSS